MGTGVDVNAGPELLHNNATGAKLGCRWFIGSGSAGHDCYSNLVTDMTVSMAIINAASTSQAAMVQAMPAGMATWFNGQSAARQTVFWTRCRWHKGWK